jgi:CDP-diacylglycerol pyrophosphatase
MKSLCQGVVVVLIALGLFACGSQPSAPNPRLVTKAIAFKLETTQEQIAQQLQVSASSPAVTVRRVKITQQHPLQILGLPTYRVQGTYQARLEQATGRVTQPDTPFDICLQRQPEGKTWRLVFPQPDRSQVRLSPPIF